MMLLLASITNFKVLQDSSATDTIFPSSTNTYRHSKGQESRQPFKALTRLVLVFLKKNMMHTDTLFPEMEHLLFCLFTLLSVLGPKQHYAMECVLKTSSNFQIQN